MSDTTGNSNLNVALVSAAVSASIALLTGYFTLQAATRTGSANRSVACMNVLGVRASLIRQRGEILMVAVAKSTRAIHKLPIMPDPQVGLDLDVAAAALVAYSDRDLQEATGLIAITYENLERSIVANDANAIQEKQQALKESGRKWFIVYREQLTQLERSAVACL